MDKEISRREFTQQALGSILLFSLMDLVKGKDLFASPIRAFANQKKQDIGFSSLEHFRRCYQRFQAVRQPDGAYIRNDKFFFNIKAFS